MQTLKNRSGIYLVDKPAGVTSHQVVNWFRRQTGIKRVGHAGTLDPFATGLLIILVSRDFTKQQSKFLKQDKQYLCTAEFGYTTDTYDIDGTIITKAAAQAVSHITRRQIERAMKEFRGTINQIVPAYSAIKRNGKKLYELAREGKIDTNKLPSRQVDIYDFSIESISKNKSLSVVFKVHCSSGTYIRSLLHDLGQCLGVGATVIQLRRIASGDKKIAEAQICPLFHPK